MSKTLEVNIDGMTCAECVKQVTESLKDVAGVQVLEVGIGTAKLDVEDSAASDAAMAAIREAGYNPAAA